MSVHQSVILFTGSGPSPPSAQDTGRGLPDMFKLVQPGPYCIGPSPPDTFKRVHNEVWTVRKLAVGRQLKCFLFSHIIKVCRSLLFGTIKQMRVNIQTTQRIR